MKIALFRREASHIDEKKLNYLAGRLTTLGADIFYCTSADSGELPADTKGSGRRVAVDPLPSAEFGRRIDLDLRNLRVRQADFPVIPREKGL